mgnify:CR=1 FL=1
MERKRAKISNEAKIEYARLCFENRISQCEAARQLGIDESTVRAWVHRYREHGELAFLDTGKNNKYSPEVKTNAVHSYLRGEGSLRAVAAKYGLRNAEQLHTWVRMYNNGEDFSRKMLGGSRMTASRKTTKEERVQIVKECLANGCNYGETAIKHNVSYQQIYSWVQRFKELGEAGLEDRRGRRKADQEPRSEVEKLQIEIEKLKHQLYMTEMERDLLKKLNELEREELFRK